MTVSFGCGSTTPLAIGWGPQEPASEITKTLSRVLAGRFSVETFQYPDQKALIAALGTGDIDLAVIEQPAAAVAGITTVAHLYPSVLHVLVRDCASTVHLEKLVSDADVYAGPEGSTGHRLLTELLAAGVLSPTVAPNILTTPFGDEPDVLMVFGGILSNDALNRLDGFCLASLGDVSSLGKGAWVEGVSYRFPQLRPFVLPAGLYPKLSPAPALTLAVPSLLAVHAARSDDDVYQIATVVTQNLDKIRAVYPLAGGQASKEELAASSTLPVHPGAQRFLDRNAPTFLERYAELLALLLTLVIAATSATVALVRIRRQARKNRLDVYFDKLLAVRSALTSRNRTIAVRQVIDLQKTVTELVVAEQIDADASLVAFYELSNQVLAEARTDARVRPDPRRFFRRN